MGCFLFFFFFQAEDGIRDLTMTGVQTCALPISANIAGVPRIVVCTPPGPGGAVDPATLVAADLCGVHEIYRVGGAQAVAALAYGTASIARVHKITGPGSGFVTAAKRFLYGTVDVGLPAGPSEAITLADASAEPELIARDLLIEAEHGPDSSSLLVTDSRDRKSTRLNSSHSQISYA